MLEGDLHDAVAQGRRGRAPFAVRHQFQADHQPLAPHIADGRVAHGHLSERVHHVRALGARVLDAAVLQHIDGGQRRRRRNGIAAVGVAVRARRPGVDAAPRDDAAQRDAAGDALGRADDVRLHAPVLDGPPLACAPHARLHLVHNQQDVVLIAHLAQTREETGRRHHVTALALDRLHQDAGHILGRHQALEHHLLQVVDDGVAVVLVLGTGHQLRAIRIGVGHVGHVGDGREAFALHGLARRKGQRSQRAPVEAAHEADEAAAVGVVMGQLDGSLHRFCA